VLESSQESTQRLCQSITAAKYMYPFRIGITGRSD
jgi:hypothetical protein